MRKNKNSPQNKRASFVSRLSPSLVVCIVTAVVMLLITFGGSLRSFFIERLYPNIAFQQGHGRGERQGKNVGRAAQPVIFDGEVYRTEGRLREASAIAIAATLSGIAILSERRPVRDVDELLNNMSKRGLLPPGVELVASRNLLVSEHSTIYVRLRPAPFAVEIISLGRERLDGPALLLRVPEERQSANLPARYFYSLTLTNVKVPEPFAIPSAVLACGWQADTIRPELTVGANPAQLASWANELKQR